MPSTEPQTEYEKIRQRNMLNNEKLLQELLGQNMDVPSGLAAGFAVLGIAEPKPKPNPKKVVKPKPKAAKPKVEKDDEEVVEREGKGTRRSARQASKPSVSYAKDGEGIVDRSKMPKMVSRPDKDWNEDDTDEGEDGEVKVRVNKLVGRVHDPKTFGLIPGVPIGSWWETRAECSAAAIHAPFVAGISGGPQGAYSVALSGGYDDDIDMGDAFTYTGSGGRDLKGTAKNPKNLRTAPQSSDQSFDHSFNKSLKISCDTRKPVRVIRGYKLPSVYAPESGYRYDGLYIVERAWMDPGNNPKKWKVCKFAFRRVPGQPPIPQKGIDVKMESEEGEEEEEEEEEESKAKKGPKGKGGKAKVGPKSKVEPKEEPEEEDELAQEEKPNKGRKVRIQDEEVEEDGPEEEEGSEPVAAKKGPKSESKRGRKPKVQSEPEEEEEEEGEDEVPPAKRSKVEEGKKKKGRPAKK
ncbi:hypothetical protein RSOLAG22IIIB_06286 [Rhizoctonia solani]|uniref:YDG domain-containing protein n=1 Tax=Rhizoctonia solani TaxID=456999 RepID=A0A0K6GDB8_9AGAM|nr:hypothetical protein RSOLAG22IIIB_06286 [Rhizoctonia solani]